MLNHIFNYAAAVTCTTTAKPDALL